MKEFKEFLEVLLEFYTKETFNIFAKIILAPFIILILFSGCLMFLAGVFIYYLMMFLDFILTTKIK